MNILRLHICVVVLVISLYISSCSGADPVIYDLQWTMQAVSIAPTTHKIIERLVLYILADDEDGFDEIYELYVIHDDSDVYWRVTSNEWKEFSINNKIWIGVNALTRENKTAVPRGAYRVLLRDLSGYEDEQQFTLSVSSAKYTAAMIPRLQFEENGLYIPFFESRARGVGMATGFVQLVHPSESKEGTKTTTVENLKYICSLLGEDGMLYKVKHGVPFLLNSEEATQFSVYMHYRKNDKLMLSSGPYDISLK